MTHDWSHLDEAAISAISENCIKREEMPPGDAAYYDGYMDELRDDAVSARQATLSALTPSDLSALLAEKCPGWVAIPKELNKEMQRSLWMNGVEECEYDVTRQRIYDELISAAPKLGEDN